MPEMVEAASSAASTETLGGDSENSVASDGGECQLAAPAPQGAEREGAPTALLAGTLWDTESPALLESSLVRYCYAAPTSPDPVPDGLYWGVEPSAATRSDGGILGDFIYATPRCRPTPPKADTRKGYSERLSSKGARGIQAAAEIAYRNGQPFKAMWVFSVNDAALARFLPPDGFHGDGKPELTLSGELRRFFRAFDDYCANHGWPRAEYAWAAESKSSGEREYHPHVHCLITLVVPRSDFEALTTTAERIWTHGSVNMTTLRKPRNAAAYCLKGVSYSVKGSSTDQGKVWGRRYGITRKLRHKEERETHESSVDASIAIVSVANRLRDLERGSVKTAYGSFTPRGFYPHQGATWAQVTVAAHIALAELAKEVNIHAPMDSPVPF